MIANNFNKLRELLTFLKRSIGASDNCLFLFLSTKIHESQHDIHMNNFRKTNRLGYQSC
jgi:hypothetical protein